MKIKNVLIPLLTLTLCMTVLYRWTMGFSSFTIFSYTLEKAEPIGKEFPSLELINQDSIVFNFENQQVYKLINFVYLNCPYVCHKVNNQIEEIYRKIDGNIINDRLQFTTISFDTENDNIHKIKNYRNFFGDDIDGWNFALPYQVNEGDFNRFLKTIGVWIYKQSITKIINHSTNLYLISPDNKIIKIFDPNREDNQTIINEIEQCLKIQLAML